MGKGGALLYSGNAYLESGTTTVDGAGRAVVAISIIVRTLFLDLHCEALLLSPHRCGAS